MTDDDRALLALIELMLLSAGYTVLTARTSELALQLYPDNHLMIDVVLAGLNLAVDPGLDLAEKLSESNPGLLFICISGDPNGAQKVSSLHHQLACL